MIKEYSEKLDFKIRKYLKKQFPRTKLIKLERLPSKHGDVYGFKGIMVMVWEEVDAVYYKVILKK